MQDEKEAPHYGSTACVFIQRAVEPAYEVSRAAVQLPVSHFALSHSDRKTEIVTGPERADA